VPRKSKSSRTPNTPDELNRPIDTQGNDPSPVVNALMSDDFLKGSNLDASQIALLLQQLVRGQNSLLANYAQTHVEIARLREKQDRIDKEIADRLQSQTSEIQNILDRAESLKQTGDQKDRTIAEGVQEYREAVNLAKASRVSDNLMFEQQIRSMPTEMVTSPGQLITTMENGSQVAKLIPEEIRIKHKVWLLNPGQQTEVPKCVADALRERRKSQAETAKRAELLSKHMESGKLSEQWNNLRGSKTLTMPS
jgi:acyl-CoA synthetase (NDP forming)